MAKKFTVRSKGYPNKKSYDNLEDAYQVALTLAEKSGKDTSVIEHDGDNTRLVKKIFHV